MYLRAGKNQVSQLCRRDIHVHDIYNIDIQIYMIDIDRYTDMISDKHVLV